MRYLHPSHIFPDDRRREGENPPPAPDTSEDELVRNFSAGMGLEQNGGMERKTNAKVTLKFFVFGPQMRGGGKRVSAKTGRHKELLLFSKLMKNRSKKVVVNVFMILVSVQHIIPDYIFLFLSESRKVPIFRLSLHLSVQSGTKQSFLSSRDR